MFVDEEPRARRVYGLHNIRVGWKITTNCSVSVESFASNRRIRRAVGVVGGTGQEMTSRYSHFLSSQCCRYHCNGPLITWRCQVRRLTCAKVQLSYVFFYNEPYHLSAGARSRVNKQRPADVSCGTRKFSCNLCHRM